MSFAHFDFSIVTPTLVLYSSLAVAVGAVLWTVFVDKALVTTRSGQQHPLGWRQGGQPKR